MLSWGSGVADEKPHELLIIKRHRGGHGGHHGGAWKIAFADFMTAMMALFLVLWLISATSEKTKVSIARYFNPVKLVDMSTMKRGVSDPNESIATSPDPGDARPRSDDSRPQGGKGEVPPKVVATGEPTHNEAALFRDPYAVLAEIVASGQAVETAPGMTSNGMTSNGQGKSDNGPVEPFRDPFKIMTPDVPADPPPDQKKPTNAHSKADEANANSATPPTVSEQSVVASQNDPSPVLAQPTDAAAQQQAPGKAQTVTAPGQNQASSASKDEQQNPGAGRDAEAAKLQSEIATEIGKIVGKTANEARIPNIEVKASDEGILISLTDQYNYSMFAIGSAEPQARTIQVMDKVAAILKKYPGAIIIRGHTDARPYKSANYDNWRLSSARAHMAHYMLLRGGLDEKRVEKIEGYADRRLKDGKDPQGEENRRIEILLRRDRT